MTANWADLAPDAKQMLVKLEENAAPGVKAKMLFGIRNDLTRQLRALGLTDKSGNNLTAAARTLLDSRHSEKQPA
jgi:hypothetical protein